jgi:hypothetical protein
MSFYTCSHSYLSERVSVLSSSPIFLSDLTYFLVLLLTTPVYSPSQLSLKACLFCFKYLEINQPLLLVPSTKTCPQFHSQYARASPVSSCPTRLKHLGLNALSSPYMSLSYVYFHSQDVTKSQKEACASPKSSWGSIPTEYSISTFIYLIGYTFILEGWIWELSQQIIMEKVSSKFSTNFHIFWFLLQDSRILSTGPH